MLKPKLYRYRGHRYRVAGRVRSAQEPAPEEGEESAASEQQEGKEHPLVMATKKAAKRLLDQHKISAIDTPVKIQQEADGLDVVYNVGNQWQGVTALLTFDFNTKGNLKELVLELCGVLHVAHTAEEQKELLSALQTLNQAEFYPEKAQDVVQDKRKDQYVKFLEYWVAEMLKAGMVLPDIGEDYKDRAGFIKAVEELGGTKETPGAIPLDRAKNLADGARILSDTEWVELIQKLEAAGTRYMTKQELVDSAVDKLVQHEQYSGAAHIVGADQDGDIIAALEVPPPAQSMMYVLHHEPGQQELQLKNSAVGWCNVQFASEADEQLSRRLVTALVDLVKAANTDVDPELSRPPEIEDEGWTEEKLNAAFRKGLVIWEDAGGARIVWKGNPVGSCYSEEEYAHEKKTPDTTLQNHLGKAATDKAKVFRVNPEGMVDQMNYRFEPTQSNIARFNNRTQQFSCPVR